MKNKQRGIAGLLALALIVGIAGTGYAVMQPAAGTYSVVADRGTLIVTDTRSGTMQRCAVAGTRMSCEEIHASE